MKDHDAAECSEATPAQLGEPKVILTAKEAERFWAKVDKGPHPKGCWVWTGCDQRGKGYGGFRFRGRGVGVHRLSYEIHKGVAPANLLVCHECDNRLCVNPDHLWLGTNQDNMTDMVKKGRHVNGAIPAGENCYAAKITEIQILEMRAIYLKGGTSQRKLGERFGIGQMQVCRILRGERWKHLKLEPLRYGTGNKPIPECENTTQVP